MKIVAPWRLEKLFLGREQFKSSSIQNFEIAMQFNCECKLFQSSSGLQIVQRSASLYIQIYNNFGITIQKMSTI